MGHGRSSISDAAVFQIIPIHPGVLKATNWTWQRYVITLVLHAGSWDTSFDRRRASKVLFWHERGTAVPRGAVRPQHRASCALGDIPAGELARAGGRPSSLHLVDHISHVAARRAWSPRVASSSTTKDTKTLVQRIEAGRWLGQSSLVKAKRRLPDSCDGRANSTGRVVLAHRKTRRGDAWSVRMSWRILGGPHLPLVSG